MIKTVTLYAVVSVTSCSMYHVVTTRWYNVFYQDFKKNLRKTVKHLQLAKICEKCESLPLECFIVYGI